MDSNELIKGQKYRRPGGKNVFTFGGRYDNNKRCFTRQDGERHYGREFIEFKDGWPYLDLELVEE